MLTGDGDALVAICVHGHFFTLTTLATCITSAHNNDSISLDQLVDRARSDV